MCLVVALPLLIHDGHSIRMLSVVVALGFANTMAAKRADSVG